MFDASLIAKLPPLQRMALAYAPAQSRGALTALFSLDARLANIVRHSHEPMLAQLRLAWWRENIMADMPAQASGDPLMAQLGNWPGK
jgi:phytoene synthase